MEEPKKDKDNNLIMKLGIDDSALVVRVDGTVELVSSELTDKEDGYIGDIEDLNKTFALVLALAASLEDQDLYDRIYFNLNKTLMRQWEDLDDNKKERIIEKRRKKDEERNDEEREEKNKRVDNFKDRMNQASRGDLEEQQRRMMQDLHDEAEFMRKYSEEFAQSRKRPRKRKPSLRYLKDVNWNPYDDSLVSHFKHFRCDDPPEEE
tara:strand:+ start:2570 stop:3190 length:621 start_codon:yes stop_codon:yes gene_type:complete